MIRLLAMDLLNIITLTKESTVHRKMTNIILAKAKGKVHTFISTEALYRP